MSKWFVAMVIVVIVGIGAAFAVWGHDGDWGPDRDGIVTRSVAVDGTETIVVHERRGGFFPFGLFVFPLVIFFTIFALRGLAFRGRSVGYGPWMHGSPGAGELPGWFDEWHRKAHSPDSPRKSADREQDSSS